MAEEGNVNLNPIPKGNVGEIVKNNEIPNYYINGFVCGYSVSEAHIIFNQHGVNSCLVQMSFPALKSLSIAINKMVANYEGKFGETISNLDERKQKVGIK